MASKYIVLMLRRCHTRIMPKQNSDCERISNSLQVNVQPFYRNREAINHITLYLRKRIVTVGTPAEDTPKQLAPKAMLLEFHAPETRNFFTFHLGDWWQHKKKNMRKFMEEYFHQEYSKLGYDLGAAKFIIKLGGKVKFKNHEEWIDSSKNLEITKLPNEYDETYILESLNLNGYPLAYEHLNYIFNLYYLKNLSFRGCETMNDWALDKISAEYPMLEHLDISECENVTERGLESLYRMPSLRKLTVTNYYGSAAFDLTCLMLEDINPYLTCEVQQAKIKRLPVF